MIRDHPIQISSLPGSIDLIHVSTSTPDQMRIRVVAISTQAQPSKYSLDGSTAEPTIATCPTYALPTTDASLMIALGALLLGVLVLMTAIIQQGNV